MQIVSQQIGILCTCILLWFIPAEATRNANRMNRTGKKCNIACTFYAYFMFRCWLLWFAVLFGWLINIFGLQMRFHSDPFQILVFWLNCALFALCTWNYSIQTSEFAHWKCPIILATLLLSICPYLNYSIFMLILMRFIMVSSSFVLVNLFFLMFSMHLYVQGLCIKFLNSFLSTICTVDTNQTLSVVVFVVYLTASRK